MSDTTGALLIATLVCVAATAAVAETRTVRDADEFHQAVEQAAPGDTILLADGEWSDVLLTFDAEGVEDSPITVAAQTPGQVVITGESVMAVRGSWLIVSGLMFRGCCPPPGDTPDYLAARGVLKRQTLLSAGSENLRVTQCALIDNNPPDAQDLYAWVGLGGRDVRFDHCYVRGQTHQQATVVVGVSETPVHARIDNNYFAGRIPLGHSNAETIRIGYSGVAHFNARCVVERNLFEDCDGESEIITNKSCENTYRYNTFRRNAGHLTLRHGDRCRVEGNYFLGDGKEGSAGVRVIGEDHLVVNNYIADTSGFGVTLYAGWTGSPETGYWQVRRLLMAYNTIVNTGGPCLELGGHYWEPEEYGALMPEDCTFAWNAMSRSGGPVIEARGECRGLRWHDNMVQGESAGVEDPGVRMVDDLKLALDPAGVLRPTPESPLAGAATPFPDALRRAEMLWNPDHLTLDIEGDRRGDRRDVGCFTVTDRPLKQPPLTAADVGPEWMRAEGGQV